MKTVRDRWGDLGVRVTSAIVMLVLAYLALALGSMIFTLAVVCLAALGLYELINMARHKLRTQGTFTSADLMVLTLYAAVVVFGAFGIITARLLYGVFGVLAIIALVVTADSAAYFVGRKVGGPKFWPSISPKKTWSGTIGAWAATGYICVVLAGWLWFHTMAPTVGEAVVLFVLGMVIALVSQLGDIFESAIKRRMGVKDSSNLIPGHGGVLDRFDGLLAVGCVCLVVFVTYYMVF